ncbi:hypothetical protein A3860_36485 [Niastella vici]|uniref:ATPase AAA-type core domain-containing protein n=1 Tax=Niastella vici TaxID=1703345 RepID=A0A1V9FMV6_9BACT|nr:ATP-binding protein [Niastella vici]OQP59670.1 hypothetical protein A3860_36485 [Niastella vici]
MKHSFLVRKFRNFLFYLSGAKLQIIERLPEKDKAPYLSIGLYQLLILIVFTGASQWAILYKPYYVPFVFLCFSYLIVLAVVAVLMRANRHWVNKTSHAPSLHYWFMALLISGGTTFVLYLNNTVKDRVANNDSYWHNMPISELPVYVLLHPTAPAFILAFAVYIVMITLFYIIIRKVRQLQSDFYHTLLAEMEKQESEGLQAERQRIQDEFRLQSELINRQVALEELRGKDAAAIKATNTGSSLLPIDLSPHDLFIHANDKFKFQDFTKALEYINKAIELDDRKQATDPGYFPHPEYHELKAKILQASGNPTGSKAALDRFVELDKDNKYRVNLTKEILLDRVKFQNLPFFGSFEWNLTPGVNILLGKNGYGKTHLLRLIIALLYGDRDKMRDWIPANAPADTLAKAYVLSDHPVQTEVVRELNRKLDELFERRADPANSESTTLFIDKQVDECIESIDQEQRRIVANKDNITSRIGRVPVLAISDSRFITRSGTVIANTNTTSEDLRKDGATEFLYGGSLEPIINKSLFIVAQNNRSDFSKEPYPLIQRVISELAEPGPLKSIAAGTPQRKNTGGETANTFFRFSRIETVPATGDFRFFVQSEENKQEVPLQSISQGTLSILSICLVIYRFLSELRPQSSDPLYEKAIVLIDEIDAHLHPSWEQKIIGLLRREFPNVQFIITAHSPLIVAGCLEKEVNIIRHTNTGFYLEQPTKNFIGYSTPELFKAIFEIEDRDPHYLYYAALSSREAEFRSRLNLLQEKKEKGALTPAQQQELDELQKDLNYIKVVNRVQQKEAEVSTLRTLDKTWKQEAEHWKKELELIKSKQL